MIGEVYRQLKKNQMDDKNWSEAGDSYRSEMVMKRRVLWRKFRQKPWKVSIILNLIVMFFHGALSAYQQSIARPLFLLFLSWLGFSLAYYLNNAYPDIPELF